MTATRILFVDDKIERLERFKRENVGIACIIDYAADAVDAIGKLETNSYDIVFLDHDLDETKQNMLLDNEQDGRYIVAAICRNPRRYEDTIFVLHSLNEPARKLMFSTLVDASLSVSNFPFAWQHRLRLRS